MDEILLQENQKVSSEKGAYENIESEIDDSKIYQIYNMSLDDTKEKLERSRRAFECELKNIYDIEIQNGVTHIRPRMG